MKLKEIKFKHLIINSFFGYLVFMLGIILFFKFIMPTHEGEVGYNILPWEGYLFLVGMYVIYTISLFLVELFRAE